VEVLEQDLDVVGAETGARERVAECPSHVGHGVSGHARRLVSASEAPDWPTGGAPGAVCDGDRRFVVTLRPLLPGERP